MEENAEDLDGRIAALGTVMPSLAVRTATETLVDRIEDPSERRAAPRGLRGYQVSKPARRIFVGALISLAGLSVAVPAAAVSSLLARTGEFGDPNSGTETDASEWINLDAPDVEQVVAEEYPDYLSLPEGLSAEHAMFSVNRALARGEGITQESLITQTYEAFAICAWTKEWLNGLESADDTRADAASEWLAVSTHYPALVKADAGGVIAALTGFVDGGRAGDNTQVDRLYNGFSCPGLLEGVAK